MAEFARIDPSTLDFSNARRARKVARVAARPAATNERVVTRMKDGHVETENVAAAGDVVVTNPSGETYLVAGDEFRERYRETGEPGVFEPAAGPVAVIVVDRDVEFEAPWGETMRIKAGGVLLRDDSGVRGVQAEEFAETYRYLDG